MKAIGMYVYAGGFSVGIQKAGFNVIAHLEDEKPYGQEVIEMNQEKFFTNLAGVIPQSQWKSHDYGEIDLLFANPPCAPFSMTNFKRVWKWRDDPRISMIYNVIGKGLELQPRIFTFESVIGCFKRGWEMLEELTGRCQNAGYAVTVFMHNINFHGSAQSRERMLFIAHKVDLNWPVIDGKRTLVGERLLERNLSGATWNCKHPHLLKEARWDWSIRDAFHEWWPQHFAERPKGIPAMFGGVRVHDDRHCRTFTGHPWVHPDEDRFLTMQEVQQLADFPLSYKFPDHVKSAHYMARGLSPIFAEWAGRVFRSAIEQGELPKKNFQILDGRKGSIEDVTISEMKKKGIEVCE